MYGQYLFGPNQNLLYCDDNIPWLFKLIFWGKTEENPAQDSRRGKQGPRTAIYERDFTPRKVTTVEK